MTPCQVARPGPRHQLPAADPEDAGPIHTSRGTGPRHAPLPSPASSRFRVLSTESQPCLLTRTETRDAPEKATRRAVYKAGSSQKPDSPMPLWEGWVPGSSGASGTSATKLCRSVAVVCLLVCPPLLPGCSDFKEPLLGLHTPVQPPGAQEPLRGSTGRVPRRARGHAWAAAVPSSLGVNTEREETSARARPSEPEALSTRQELLHPSPQARSPHKGGPCHYLSPVSWAWPGHQAGLRSGRKADTVLTTT